MRQTAFITLEITFDNETQEHPANWNWPELLDVPDPSDVVVVSAE